MFDFDSLRKFLFDVREAQRKTREQVAAIIGITPEAIRNFETGTSHMKVENIMRLLDVYGMDGSVLDRYYKRSEQMQTIMNIQANERS